MDDKHNQINSKTHQLNAIGVNHIFTLDDLKNAFSAGRMVENYKGEWEETYYDECTSAKYKQFNDWYITLAINKSRHEK